MQAPGRRRNPSGARDNAPSVPVDHVVRPCSRSRLAAAGTAGRRAANADDAARPGCVDPRPVAQRGHITSYVIEASPSAAMNAGSTSAGQGASHPKEVQGSGFVVDPSGVILTNNHVIDGAYDVHVKLSDGTVVSGRVLATAARIDLALVKIDTQHPLTVVHWGDSDKVQIGDSVFAIGNALGIGLSVTSGIVSALNRNIMDTPFVDFIQTDAAINHGNSGGPLFNRQGEVIGVDTAIISPTTGSVGLGFAIPSNDARFVSSRLMQGGQIVLPYLGVKVEQ